MQKRKRFRFMILGIAAIALLMAISGNAQHGAWMQGYASGLAAAGGDAAAAAPMMAHHGFHGGFGIIGGIFRLGLFLLMFTFILKMFGFMMWRLSGRTDGPPWAHHWGCGAPKHLDSGDGSESTHWNRDQWREKWRERKRAWAKEAGFEENHAKDGDDDRPAEERFVV